MGKTQVTRARLRTAALHLFAERGYDETTVAEIAAAAGVTPMTFFRHFPSKDAVVVEDPYDPAIAQAVADQPSDLPVLERVRRGLLTAWDAIPPADTTDFRTRLAIGAGHPGLRARMRENGAATEAAVVAALTEQGTARFEAVVAAAAVVGALTTALLEWATSPDSRSMAAAVVEALAVLEPEPAR